MLRIGKRLPGEHDLPSSAHSLTMCACPDESLLPISSRCMYQTLLGRDERHRGTVVVERHSTRRGFWQGDVGERTNPSATFGTQWRIYDEFIAA